MVGFSLLSHYFFQRVLLPGGLLDSTYYLLPSSLNSHSTHLEAGFPDGRVWDCLLVSHQEKKQYSSCHLFSIFLHCGLHFWPALGWPECGSAAYPWKAAGVLILEVLFAWCWGTCSNCFCFFRIPNGSPNQVWRLHGHIDIGKPWTIPNFLNKHLGSLPVPPISRILHKCHVIQ